MADLYHRIYDNEIFRSSECIWHENTTLDLLRSLLKSQGYSSADSSNKVWQRGDRTVVVCLVDDYTTCAQYPTEPISRIFDSQTLVVTDNCVLAPTRYQVLTLPDSFFGIYAHRPETRPWQPQRRFTFAVNRIDIKRMLLFLEIVRSAHLYYADPDNLDFVNFNCWSWAGDNTTTIGLQQNFQTVWHQLEPPYQELYGEYYTELMDRMPLRNHDMSLEQSYHASGMNVIIETYSGESVIALSEKTFAALTSGAPWTLYAGRHSVSYLDSLGFDTLGDLIPHRYDSLVENRSATEGDKMIEFVCGSRLLAHELQQQDHGQLVSRLQKAARHNQDRLCQFRQQWAQDFAEWLPRFIDAIR
jgi:hypothetical protein